MIDDGDNNVVRFYNMKIKTVAFDYSYLPETNAFVNQGPTLLLSKVGPYLLPLLPHNLPSRIRLQSVDYWLHQPVGNYSLNIVPRYLNAMVGNTILWIVVGTDFF